MLQIAITGMTHHPSKDDTTDINWSVKFDITEVSGSSVKKWGSIEIQGVEDAEEERLPILAYAKLATHLEELFRIANQRGDAVIANWGLSEVIEPKQLPPGTDD